MSGKQKSCKGQARFAEHVRLASGFSGRGFQGETGEDKKDPGLLPKGLEGVRGN